MLSRQRTAIRAVPVFLAMAFIPLAVTAGSVELEFFFEPGCAECALVRETVLPELDALYGGRYRLRNYDVGVASNYLRLAALMERYDADHNAPVCTHVDNVELLSGVEAIHNRLLPLVAAQLDAAETGAPPESARAPAQSADPGADILARRLEGFTLAGVLIGGLGLLHVFHALQGFRTLQRAVNAGMIGLLALLAALSLVDALRYRRTRRGSDVLLRLPERLKSRIQRRLRLGLGRGGKAVTAFGLGVLP